MRPVAIVTGGSSGIGRATALRLADDGFDVGITFNRGQARANEVARAIEALGVRAAIAHQNLSNPVEAPEAINSLINQLGRVDAFVSNAGINHRRDFLEMPLDEWMRVLNVNLTGSFLSTQVAAKYMVSHGIAGRIVNVTSVLDREVLEGGSAYCSSKAALRQLTRVMALELARYKIRVNGVAPGETATPMNFQTEVDAADVARPVTPMGRPGYSEEIASTISFLLSEGSGYITGEVLLVDGGLALHGGPQSLQKTVGKPAPLQTKAAAVT